MDAPNLPTMLDILSALRVAYADLPAAKLAVILPQLDPETAARVQAIITECDQRATPLPSWALSRHFRPLPMICSS